MKHSYKQHQKLWSATNNIHTFAHTYVHYNDYIHTYMCIHTLIHTLIYTCLAYIHTSIYNAHKCTYIHTYIKMVSVTFTNTSSQLSLSNLY